MSLPRVAGRPGGCLSFSPSALAGSHSEVKAEVHPLPGRGKRKGGRVNLNKGRCASGLRARRVCPGGPPGFSERPEREGPGRSCLLPTLAVPTPPLRSLAITSPEGCDGGTDAARLVREGRGLRGPAAGRPPPWPGAGASRRLPLLKGRGFGAGLGACAAPASEESSGDSREGSSKSQTLGSHERSSDTHGEAGTRNVVVPQFGRKG